MMQDLKSWFLTDRAIELNKIIEIDIVEIDKKMTAGLSDEEISAFIATIQKIKKKFRVEQEVKIWLESS